MTASCPINIVSSSRSTSSSSERPHQTSHNSDAQTPLDMMVTGSAYEYDGPRTLHDSTITTANPIPVNIPIRNSEGRLRSSSLSGSFAQPASLGGLSVGSWMRDDIIMTGTSPFPHQSASFNSSSYLPKLEADFMKNFTCCGITIHTLHDLLQHYEELHAPQRVDSSHSSKIQESSTAVNITTTTNTGLIDNINTKGSSPTRTSTAPQPVPEPHRNSHSPPQPPHRSNSPQQTKFGEMQLLRPHQQSQTSSPTSDQHKFGSDEMDTVENMELDEVMEPLDDSPETPTQTQSQSLFGKHPQLILNLSSSGLSHSGLRSSQPSTPSSAGFSFQNNPTVSSVNTPTLSAHPSQSSHQFPLSVSGPGTPSAETDHEAANFSSQLNHGNLNHQISSLDFPYIPGTENMGIDYCIDEPAKRLYSPNGFHNQRFHHQYARFGPGDTKNEIIAQAQRAQHMYAMVNPHAAAMMMGAEELKPFRCPVVGCEKAYKNQNGLKYHKTHGHNTQQLHQNDDGTFSIMDPVTSTPYPGNLGMEKEKPYKCESCNKRYKNLNGLKYHKQHSPQCNLEFHLASQMISPSGLPMGISVSNLSNIGTHLW